eukprot:XP_008766847.1 PREDICTED: vomeronasal type-2 receptor 116-like [Rattus norvegicus]
MCPGGFKTVSTPKREIEKSSGVMATSESVQLTKEKASKEIIILRWDNQYRDDSNLDPFLAPGHEAVSTPYLERLFVICGCFLNLKFQDVRATLYRNKHQGEDEKPMSSPVVLNEANGVLVSHFLELGTSYPDLKDKLKKLESGPLTPQAEDLVLAFNVYHERDEKARRQKYHMLAKGNVGILSKIHSHSYLATARSAPPRSCLATGRYTLYLMLLSVFQFPHLTYGHYHPVPSDHENFPYLYQMASDDTSLALALVSFIIHFSWNWIGLAFSDNDQGTHFLSYLKRGMEKNAVCLAFVSMIPVDMHLYMSRAEVYYSQILTSSANVVIIYGDTGSTLAVSFRMWESLGLQRLWITTTQLDVTPSMKENIYGLFAFGHHHGVISGFKNFVQTLNPVTYSNDNLAKLEWMHFNCEVSASKWKTLKNFSSNHSLEWLMENTFEMTFSEGSYNIYNAVYTVAHVLHKMTFQKFHNLPNAKGKVQNYVCNKVVLLTLFNMPTSVCSADCGPGFRKFRKKEMSACCFDCSPCPENEISNETNMEMCVLCPEDKYANTGQNDCIPKALIFLSYEDHLGMALSLMALGFSAFTAVVLGIFVKHHSTPIVKANNRTLTYILLLSLIFCFLCPLLFIGHPDSVTCILQQITFGVLFTVAISTVLAKTITVILAFKVTAPQRMMKYFLLSGVSMYIIPICTLIQVIVCAVCLGVSPPSVDIDAQSEHGHIIVVCNNGSVTCFYSVLGYLACLTFVSFTLAFLSRNLPGAFNEAKSITFSMLVVCSVWVTFLPVYHSTKGKIMVAVEIISILASSSGMLVCIFIPKCYIILFRPEKNSLKMIREKSPSHTHIS